MCSWQMFQLIIFELLFFINYYYKTKVDYVYSPEYFLQNWLLKWLQFLLFPAIEKSGPISRHLIFSQFLLYKL